MIRRTPFYQLLQNFSICESAAIFKNLEAAQQSDFVAFIKISKHRSLREPLQSERVLLKNRDSGWRDSNPRPLEPHSSALPSCATARLGLWRIVACAVWCKDEVWENSDVQIRASGNDIQIADGVFPTA